MNLGPHAAFIIASYAATAFVVAALLAWVIVDGRHLARRLAELDAKGLSRRGGSSGGNAGKTPGDASDA